MTTPDTMKEVVRREYADRILGSENCCEGAGCCGPPGETGAGATIPPAEMPDSVVSFGCGNPVALAGLRSGETVLDLGSGAGLDCFLAAERVGPPGHVIGVDFTRPMIARAGENASKLGLDGVEFRLGDIEALPLEDASVDVVISNCVINLAPDKDAVFREAFRVLRGGGRLMVSDIVLTRAATEEERGDLALLTGCVSGSLPAQEYAAKVRAAGFADVTLEGEGPGDGQFWFSAAISGTRP